MGAAVAKGVLDKIVSPSLSWVEFFFFLFNLFFSPSSKNALRTFLLSSFGVFKVDGAVTVGYTRTNKMFNCRTKAIIIASMESDVHSMIVSHSSAVSLDLFLFVSAMWWR